MQTYQEKIRRQYLQQERKRHERRGFLLDYLGGACVRCGTDKDLEFDHIDPRTKYKKISSLIQGNLQTLLAEAKKCQILCRKCHIEKSKEDKTIAYQRQGKHFWTKCPCDTCKEARRVHLRTYRAQNREKVNTWAREWRRKNRNKINASRKRSYWKNPEKARADIRAQRARRKARLERSE